MNTQTVPSISRILKSFFLGCTCFAAVLLQTPAIAQSAADEPLEEIVVTGIRRSLDIAAHIKRESDQVVDALTAQDIGLFSDNNVGEALARVPGVLLEREAGEGYRISVRGLGPRFVRTTINGRTALSPAGGETGNGDDARGFTYNILPSEVISKVAVYKSTQAREIEGGIGGVVDLTTNRPLEFKPEGDNFYVSGTLRGTYNDLSEDSRYRGTIFLNNKFNENLGVFFAVTIDEADRIDNLAESQRLRTFDHDLDAGTILNGEVLTEDLNNQDYSNFSGVRYQEQLIPRDRETYVGGVQWQGGNWDLNFDWIYGIEDEVRDDKRFWYGFGDLTRRFEGEIVSLTVDTGDAAPDQTVPTLGTIVANESSGISDFRRTRNFVAPLYRQVPRNSNVNAGGLSVEWSNDDDWTIAGDFGYARQVTDRILERLRTRLDERTPRFTDGPNPGVSATYDIRSGYPIAQVFDSFGEPIDPLDTSYVFFDLLENNWTNEEAEDVSARLDFTKVLEPRNDGDIYSFFDEIQFGVAWNEMQFSRATLDKEYDGPDFDLTTIRPAFASNILTDVNIPGFVHEFALYDINDPQIRAWLDNPGQRVVDQGSTFDVTEETTSFYVQGNFSGEGRLPYRGNIGFRYVETDQTNIGWVGQGSGDGFVPADPDNPLVTTGRAYDDLLPSLNLVLELSDEWLLRFAANEAVTRPDPIDMSARLELDDLDDDEERTGEGGNPDLEPYKTTSFDASAEWYPERGGSYGLGLFYKDLDGFIASGSSSELVGVNDGAGGIALVEYEIDRPVNTDGGTIAGVEFQFHTPLDFLPGFWQYFGINGSYTYVDAEMDAVIPDRGVPISLRGTSERSGNLALYSERAKFGARVAANYRSDYLFQEASDNDRFDEFTEGRTIIDMNLDYIIMENMKVRFTANNLTEERRERYWNTPGQYYSDERDNGRAFVLEFRYASE
jgi:iron complex outermembrane receptor protein